MERNLNRMGISTVGQLAKYPLELLEKRFGILGNQLYYHAHGIDLSEIGAPLLQGQIGYGKSQILLRDYTKKEDIKTVLLEICEQVARRARTRIIKQGVQSGWELVTVKMRSVAAFTELKRLIYLQISQWTFIDIV